MTVPGRDPDLQRLLDIEEVKRLKARYFRTLDRKQWDDWGQVFAKDALLEVPEADVVESGRAAIVASVSAALEGTRTVRQGHMGEIDITGPDTASQDRNRSGSNSIVSASMPSSAGRSNNSQPPSA